MEVKIQAVHFDATEKLEAYVEKKVAKFEKLAEGATELTVNMKVTKPQTAMNKEVATTLRMPGKELRVEKVANTFEEAVDACVDALRVQLEKYKNKEN